MSGKLTRESYIKAKRMLQTVQGRKALEAAIFQVHSVNNPEAALGPAAQEMGGMPDAGQ